MKEFGPLLLFLRFLKKKINASELEGLIGHKAIAYATFDRDFLQIFPVKQFSYIVVTQTLYSFCKRNAQEEKLFRHQGTVTKFVRKEA